MKITRIFSALILSLCIVSVSMAQTVTRSLGSFDRINVASAFEKVVLKPGTEESIQITYDDIDVNRIITEVKGTSLHVSVKGDNSWTQNGDYDITLVITFKSIREVNNSSSSDFVIDGVLKADKFIFNHSGSGDFTGEMEVKDLKVNISGSADMTLKGTADSQAYAVSGSGDIDASQLKGANAMVVISGSGDVDLNVSGTVKTAVSGSGEVNNKGQ
jgi:hypothetical protein